MSAPSFRGLDEAVDNLVDVVDRFLVGQDLDGIRRTDATFWRPGRRIVMKDVAGPVRRASYRTGWHRLVTRVVSLAALATTAGGATLQGRGRERRELLEEWVGAAAAPGARRPARRVRVRRPP
ncbi:hypothetical protein [Streptomyces sp. NPDC002394]